MSRRSAVFAVRPKVVTHPERVAANYPGKGGLQSVDVVRSDITQTIAHRGKGRVGVVTIVVVYFKVSIRFLFVLEVLLGSLDL